MSSEASLLLVIKAQNQPLHSEAFIVSGPVSKEPLLYRITKHTFKRSQHL